MTWTYVKNKDEKGLNSVDVYDHNDNLVKTVKNGAHPDNNTGPNGILIEKELEKAMKEEAEKNGPEAANSGNATSDEGVSPYGWKIMADMNAKDIKEKK